MASKAKSRWADDKDDAALDAQLKKEKEEKKRLKTEKRLKAERARALEAEQQTQDVAAPAAAATDAAPKLLRFDGGSFGRSRTIAHYDMLNGISQGSYGWVSRAKETATGEVVALKRLKIDPKDLGGVPVTALREIRVLKACGHRNVVKLKEVVVGDDTSKIETYSTDSTPLDHRAPH